MNFWHEWRGSNDGRPSMLIRNLFSFRGWKLDLHKFIRADDLACFHTHPAKALRVILWGGYVEELHESNGTNYVFEIWRPLQIGILRPELCHRIESLLNGRYSYSLWLRWPKTDEIKIYGEC